MLSQAEIIKYIYGDTITDKPKRCRSMQSHTGNLAWVFVSRERVDYTACRTVQTLTRKIESGEAKYITFSGFYRRDRRARAHVRQQRAIVLDFDSKNGGDPAWSDRMLGPLVLMERCQEAGLPYPSIIWRTPHGLQAAWVLCDPLIYGKDGKSLGLGAGIAKCMIQELGADPKAIGAERWWRVPTPENIAHVCDKVTVAALLAWRDIKYPRKSKKKRKDSKDSSKTKVYQLINWQHPDIVRLAQGVEIGMRDNSAYTLALVAKQAGWTSDDTLGWLIEWNQLNEKPLPTSQLRAKVRSAFRYNRRPGLAWLRVLDGRTRKNKTGRKNTKKLRTDHAIIYLLKGRRNKKFTGSIQSLANCIGASKRTVINALQRLQNRGVIMRLTIGKGRSAKTILVYIANQINGEKSYNTLDSVVGGIVPLSGTGSMPSVLVRVRSP